MNSSQFKIREGKKIPYYEETQKRTLWQKIRKIKNTFLMLLAYACPVAKIRICLHRWRGVNIGKNVYIGLFCFFDNLYPEYIYIEDNVGINAGTMLIAHFNPGVCFKRVLQARVEPIVIKKGAIVAVRSIIMPGVTVGENAIVAAASVVTEDVEEKTLVRGNPAKKIGKIKI